MPLDDQGIWYPDLFDRQLEVFNCRKRATLVCGPRLSGKTWAVLHRIARHLWETPDARVAMFSRTLKNSKDGGTWSLLHKVVFEEWIKAKIGFQYTTLTSEGKPGPKVDGQTRTPYCRLTNMHGGESELLLFSLDFDDDVEDKLKEMQFSLIYFSELSKFGSRKILSVALPSLRMPHLSYDDQMWIADTNPGEEGDKSWIYKVWYVEKNQTYSKYKEMNEKVGLPVLGEREFTAFQKSLDLIEIKPSENPRLDPRQLDEIKTTYAYDPGLYARYVDGKWVYGDGDQSIHFRGAYNPAIHKIGNCESLDEANWEYLNPTPSCFELVLGFDLGDVNHAVMILEKTIVNGKSCFSLLDELVSIKKEISNEEITESLMILIEQLERTCSRKLSLDRSWSDGSSLERYSAAADKYPYQQVAAASGGRINLQAIKKAPGSVRLRVQLLKQLLKEGRFYLSAHCAWTEKMLKELKKGKSLLEFVVEDENKHAFDALTYPLLGECAEDLELGPAVNEAARRPLILHVT